eukprot:1827129-Amphidinium_carterae.5
MLAGTRSAIVAQDVQLHVCDNIGRNLNTLAGGHPLVRHWDAVWLKAQAHMQKKCVHSNLDSSSPIPRLVRWITF